MPATHADSVFPRLEPLLPSVQKPIQYVGGELNSTLKEWDARRGPLGADVPRRLRGRACPTRASRSSTRCSTSATGCARRAHLLGVAGPRGSCMREHGDPAVHRRQPPAGRAPSTCSGCPSPPSSATPTCSPRSTSPASRCTRPDRTEDDPIVLAGGHAAFNPEPIADFLDAAVLGDGEEIVLAITEVVREWKAEGRPGRPPRRAAAAAWPVRAASTCRSSTTSTTCPTAGSSGSCRTVRGAVAGAQAHR